MEVDDRFKQRLCRTVRREIPLSTFLHIKNVGVLVDLSTLLRSMECKNLFWVVRNRIKCRDSSIDPLPYIKNMVSEHYDSQALDVGQIYAEKYFLLKFNLDTDLVTFKLGIPGLGGEFGWQTRELAI
jgi:hypothetical protein